MQLLSTQLHMPVLRQQLVADVHSRGIPTAFEKMAVSLVKTGQGAEELKEQSLSALFALLVGNDAADIFLDKTLDDLFSPASAILGVAPGIQVSSYRELPLSAIEVLPNGEELLRSGVFPTQARRKRISVLFDPLAGTVGKAPDGWGDSFPEDPERALAETLATDAWPEEDAEKFVREQCLRPGELLSGLSREGTGTVEWVSFPATLELEGDALKASSPQPGAPAYLNGLPPGEFRRLMLPGLEGAGTAGPVRNPADAAPADLFPAGGMPPPESWAWLHPAGDSFAAAPKGVRLEVVWPADGRVGSPEPSFSAGDGDAPDRLVLPGAPYPDASASGDPGAFCHVVPARVFFASTPMEIPLGLREHLPPDAARTLAVSLAAALGGTGHPRAFAHAVALASDRGLEDAVPALREMAASLDGEQRKTVAELCAAWKASAMAGAILPKPEPPLPRLAAPAGELPSLSYSFESGSVRRFWTLFRGEKTPDPRCEFSMTQRLVFALTKPPSGGGPGRNRPMPLPPAAAQVLRNCPFLSLAGEPVTPGVRGRHAESVLDELLRIAASRPGARSVLVTDDGPIAAKARALGIHPMSCGEFSRRIETNTLSTPIEENPHEPVP